jgi:hypothetical protein
MTDDQERGEVRLCLSINMRKQALHNSDVSHIIEEMNSRLCITEKMRIYLTFGK